MPGHPLCLKRLPDTVLDVARRLPRDVDDRQPGCFGHAGIGVLGCDFVYTAAAVQCVWQYKQLSSTANGSLEPFVDVNRVWEKVIGELQGDAFIAILNNF
jgi:hypothetical protein